MRAEHIIAILLILGIAIPLMYPVGFPIVISDLTRRCYNLIETVQKGEVVLIVFDVPTGAVADIGPLFLAASHHIFQRGGKIIIVCFVADGAPLVDRLISQSADFKGKIYGVDYVHLGFLPGGESAMVAFASDIRGIVKTDYYGNPIDKFPILQNVRSLRDIRIVLSHNSGTIVQQLRQWLPYGVKLVDMHDSMGAPAYMAYVAAGQLVTVMAGARAAAEYELLLGIRGPGLAMQDAYTLSMLLLLALIIIGNTKGRWKK